jgi:hypothetical protein
MMSIKKRIRNITIASVMLVGVTASIMPVSAASMWPDNPFAITESKVEDCTSTYEAYEINDAMLWKFVGDGINEGADFTDIFTDTVKVYGRFNKGKDYALITYIKENGNTKFLGATQIESDDKVPDIDEIAESIKKSQKSNVIDMKIGRSRQAKKYIVYLKTEEGEYVTPLYDIERGDSNKLDEYLSDGKTYTVESFLGALKERWGKYMGYRMGDTDNDGKVDVRDCSKIARTLANPLKNGNEPTLAWDYNMDDAVNVRDCADLAGDLANQNKCM